MRIVGPFTLVDELTLHDVERVIRLSHLVAPHFDAIDNKRKWRKWWSNRREASKAWKYTKPVFYILTDGKKRIRKWHSRWLKIILTQFDMFKTDEHVDNDQALKQINEVLLWMSPRLCSTPYELKRKLTPENLPELQKAIVSRQIEVAVDMAKAYHVPKQLLKEAKKILRQMRSKQLSEPRTKDPKTIDPKKKVKSRDGGLVEIMQYATGAKH